MAKQRKRPSDKRKLSATEQQLRAANQQLEASNQQLRASEGKLNAMLRSIGDHISMIDRDLNIIWANEATKKMFGDDIVGKKCYEVYHKRKEPCEPYPCLTLKAFQDENVHEHDTEVMGKDGKIIYFHRIANVALRDTEGKSTAVIEISRDITKRKRTEEMLQAANQQLRASEQQLKAANQQLQASEQQLKATNEQLRASEQQLKASNQQLQASEQQLRATNQQLRANEQKLLDDQAQLKSLASELTLAEESERHRIATELHATISQSLVVSKLQLDTLRASVPSRDIAGTLEEVCNSLDQTIQETKSLTFNLSSPILYELGFEAAVSEWLTERIQKKHHIATEFEDDGQPKPLDDDVRVLLFRDVRELLINVVKHANANKVKVSVRKVGSEIHVRVEDDGWGFDPAEIRVAAVKKGGFGLFSIRERLEQLGGHLEIESAPGHGTKATLIAPLKKEKINDGVKNER
ncbi:unnamed protein product, partial [marine sediment metagenome]